MLQQSYVFFAPECNPNPVRNGSYAGGASLDLSGPLSCGCEHPETSWGKGSRPDVYPRVIVNSLQGWCNR